MSGGPKRKSKPVGPEADVENLLRAAEDELLLKLTVDAHLTSSSSSSLDPDLARRFEALKSPPPPQPKSAAKGSASVAAADDKQRGRVLGDDLAARFAALKGPSSSDPDLGLPQPDPTATIVESGDEITVGGGGAVSEEEVEKVLQWAMDAARLDPSKSDEEEDGADTSDEDEDEEDLERKDERKGGGDKGRGKTKKWFF